MIWGGEYLLGDFKVCKGMLFFFNLKFITNLKQFQSNSHDIITVVESAMNIALQV